MGEVEEYLLQVGEGYILIHIESLYLMEEAVCTVGDRLVAIDTPWADDADRRLGGEHRAGLHRGGVGTKERTWDILHEEGILHITCRMVFGEVER